MITEFATTREIETRKPANARSIAARLKTPPIQTDPAAEALPDTLLAEQVQRVALTAMVALGLWSYGLLMDALIRPATLGLVIPPSNLVIEVAAMIVAGLMFSYVRYTTQ